MIARMLQTHITNNGQILPDPFWANVSMLLHGEGVDGGQVITDSAGKCTVSCIGGAGTGTGTLDKKFGVSSLYFPGANSKYYQIADTTNLQMSSGDFTIEFWVTTTPSSTLSRRVISLGGNANGNGYCGIAINVALNGMLNFSYSTTGTSWATSLNTATNEVLTSTWQHVAICRSGSNLYVYIDGVLKSSTTITGSIYAGTVHRFGVSTATAPASFMVGYMDEVRITKGICRYLTNFPTPSAPFSGF
jgi:hypothetical protein